MKLTRTELGLTQTAMADLLGVSQATVSRWESNDQSPTLDDLRMLYKTFGKKLNIRRLMT